MVNSKKQTTNVRIKSFDSKQNTNEKNGILFTRMYFSVKNERIGRSILLLSQFIMLFVFVITFASFSAFVASQLPIHEMINSIGIADAFFRSMLISLFIIGMLICLLFTIPLLIVNNASSVKIIGQTILVVELLISILLVIGSIIASVYSPVKFNTLGLIFSIINVCLIIIGSFLMIKSANTLVKKVSKAIDDSNKLGELDSEESKI